MKFNKNVKTTINYMDGTVKKGILNVEVLNKNDVIQIDKKYFYVDNLNRANLVIREFIPSNINIPVTVAIFREDNN